MTNFISEDNIYLNPNFLFFQGTPGPDGAPGLQGSQGEKGPDGDIGSPGALGLMGFGVSVVISSCYTK